MKRYEGMFLFDSAVATDWSAIDQEVRRLLGRIGAEPVVCVKFDDRKLAFEINGRRRGTYVLTYFDAPPNRIGELERDARLSELVLRALVLRPENLSDEKLAELKAWQPDKPWRPLSGDGRRDDRPPRGEGGEGGDDEFGGRDGGREGGGRDGRDGPRGRRYAESRGGDESRDG